MKKIDELGIEAVLNFLQHVLLKATRLWVSSFLFKDQKQRVQKVIFQVG